MDIQWKEIIGFDGKYSISITGEIKSNSDDKYIAIKKNSNNEKKVRLYYKGKDKLYDLAKLLAYHFINNYERPIQCCLSSYTQLYIEYIDGNNDNISIKNLKWKVRNANINKEVKTNDHGFIVKKIQTYNCNPQLLEELEKPNTIILCWVFNTPTMPKECEQAYICKYIADNNKGRDYIGINDDSYNNAIPVIRQYKLKKAKDLVRTFLDLKYNILVDGSYSDSNNPCIRFEPKMFLHCDKPVIKKGDGSYFIVKTNIEVQREWIELLK